MERRYNIETKARIEEIREILLNRGYKRFEELGEESFERKDIGLFLDLRLLTPYDLKKYRDKFPDGIKFPRSHLTADTISNRIIKERENEDLEMLSSVINTEMSEITRLLKQKHLTEMYVEEFLYDGQDEVIIDDMKRILSK